MRPARVHRLDAIRGGLALAIMCYHVLDGPLVVGTYGVYAFFVLSGFALEHVYRGRPLGRSFAVARIARLAPLWVPVVLASAAFYGLASPLGIALNLTAVFGFIPGAFTVVAGGWSIGMEAMFYALFPLLRALSTRWLVCLIGVTYIIRAVWVHAVWTPGLTIFEVWPQYTVLPSFLVFFALGLLLARIGDTTSWTGRKAAVANHLGDLSYGTYLLHPILWITLGYNSLATIAVTPVVALAVHRFWEVPVGALIKRRLSVQPASSQGMLDAAGARPHPEPSRAG